MSADLTALHSLPVKTHPHPHTWIVTVYWPSEPWRDARDILKSLNGLLFTMQGDYIPDLTQEGLAKMALQIDGIVKASVWREDERIGCEVWK